MSIQSTDPDTLELICFAHPGSHIERHLHNGVEVRELHIGDDVWTARKAVA